MTFETEYARVEELHGQAIDALGEKYPIMHMPAPDGLRPAVLLLSQAEKNSYNAFLKANIEGDDVPEALNLLQLAEEGIAKAMSMIQAIEKHWRRLDM